MQRSRKRVWKNGRGGRWGCRIIWFDDNPGNDLGGNIRLSLETSEGKYNINFSHLYPDSTPAAEQIWQAFKLDPDGVYNANKNY